MTYRQRGRHKYFGSRNDRFKRTFSKLGLKKQNLSDIFELMEKEKKLNWEQEFDKLIGRPVSGERIKEFIRDLLKQKLHESIKREEQGE